MLFLNRRIEYLHKGFLWLNGQLCLCILGLYVLDATHLKMTDEVNSTQLYYHICFVGSTRQQTKMLRNLTPGEKQWSTLYNLRKKFDQLLYL